MKKEVLKMSSVSVNVNPASFKPLLTKTPSILSNYGKVLSYVQNCEVYQKVALKDWSKQNITDPWLINEL